MGLGSIKSVHNVLNLHTKTMSVITINPYRYGAGAGGSDVTFEQYNSAYDLDTASTVTITSVAPVSASNRMAILIITWETGADNTSFSAASWNGQSMTSLGVNYNPSALGPTNGIQVFYLLDANFPGSSGNVTMTNVGTIGNDITAAIYQMANVSQGAPDLSTGNESSLAVSTSHTASASGGAYVEAVTDGASTTHTFTRTDSQTINEAINDTEYKCVYAYKTGLSSGSITPGWTFSATPDRGIEVSVFMEKA